MASTPTPKMGTMSRSNAEKLIAKADEGPTGKESKDAQKEGWLTKQGNYIQNWRPRWFQLKDGILYYYKDPQGEMKPTNFFVLSGARASKLVGTAFELIMANGERRRMQATTEQDRDEWVIEINKCSEQKAKTMSMVLDKSPAPAPAKNEKKMVPEDFTFMKVLGKGNYGKVMMATKNDDTTNQLYAVKIIKKSGLVDEESLEHVLAENRVLQSLEHPFLVKLYYSFQTVDRLYFVMEYVNGGELFFHIGREKRFTETRVRFYAGEILLALHYLHSKDVVYRDLKLENLLLDANGHIKITDFGLCKEGIGQEDTTSTFCGTPEYLAPEILEEENYGRSVDWWALGVVLYEMMVGKPPFGPTNNMEKLFHNIMHQPVYYPSFLSEQGKSLLEGLLCRDSSQRLGCGPGDGEEVMRHPFFAGIDFNKLLNKTYQPPFKPKVEGETDVRNFDKEFTNMPAVLTPEAQPEVLNQRFEDFTFTSDTVLKKPGDE